MRSIQPGFRSVPRSLLLLLGLAVVALAWLDRTQSHSPRSDRGPEPADAEVVEAPTLPAGLSADWWSEVQKDLAQREYHASTTEELQAPNRAQNLRATFTPGGVDIGPRTDQADSPTWRWQWQTVGFGREGALRPVGAATPVADGARIEYEREGLVEWYENKREGLEQGFIVQARPPGEGLLCITGQLGGALHSELRAEKDAVDVIDEHGALVMRYGELHVWDASGEVVPSHLRLDGTELAIVIEDRNFDYPITVDPLMSSPAWTAESNQAGASFGISVATAGDVNGDGFSDVIVGAYLYDNGQTDEGRAFVYHGSATGLSTTPAWTAESNQASAQLGMSVATAGDVNGDGFSDVIVGAHLYDNGQTDEGQAFVYHGSGAGLSTAPAWTAESNQANASFGYSVATAGDVNGDGFSDVIVGAHGYDNGETNEGRAIVYHGSGAGLSSLPGWTTESNRMSAEYGYSVATAGDVNSDGFSDVIIGARFYDNGEPLEGRAFVYHGSGTGLSIVHTWTAEGNQANAIFGISVATAGDVNGDGFSDVIVGAWGYSNGQTQEGRAFVYHGSATSLSTSPAWTAESNQASAGFGYAVATAGDVNGDGFADVIVGGLFSGRSDAFHGSGTGLSITSDWTAEFGTSVATAGDVNGDGLSDVILGAPNLSNGEFGEGRAFVYYGASLLTCTGGEVGDTWPVCGAPVGVGPGGQFGPALTPDGAGGAFIAYSDLDDDVVFLNHIDANGNPATGWPSNGFPVSALPTGAQLQPRVVADGNGGALVAWQDTRNDPGDFYWDIYLHRITASGVAAPGWPANGVSVHPITPSQDEDLIDVVGDGTGGAFVAWAGVRLIRIASSGAVHAAWPVDGLLIAAGSAKLLADGASGAYVGWVNGSGELRMLRITPLGAVAPGWAANGLLVATGCSSFDIELQLDGSHVNVAWVRSATGELHASRITSGGSIASGWPAGGVVVRSTPDPKSSLMLSHGGTSGDAVIVWREDLPAPAGFQVYAQRLTPAGTVAPGWPTLGWTVIPDATLLNPVPSCDGGTTLAFRASGTGVRAIRFTAAATVAPGWPPEGVLLCGGTFQVGTPTQDWACPDGTGGVITTLALVPPGTGDPFDRADVHAQCVRGDGTANEGFVASTPAGSGVAVQVGPASVTFATVTAPGETWLQLGDSGPPPPWGLQIVPSDPPLYYDVSTTAQYQGPVQTCITYDPASVSGPESGLQLLHYDTAAQPPAWVNVTTSLDQIANVICGSSASLSPFLVVEANPTDVSSNLPLAHRLFANVPNPFNPTTTIRCEIPASAHVRLEVLDVSGRLVSTLANGRIEAGRHDFVWRGVNADGRRAASGVYFYRLQAGSYVATRRMVLLK